MSITVQHFVDSLKTRTTRTPGRPETAEQALAGAGRRQTEMLAEVRRRLTDIAIQTRWVETTTLSAEQEADALQVHAAMPENAGPIAQEALDQRKTVLERLEALDKKRLALHGEEQRLLSLQYELGERARTLGVLVDALRTAHSTDDVPTLVDRALDATGGSAAEDDECEADF